MRRILPLTINPDREDRPADYSFDPTFSPEMVQAFLEAYTRPGDVVFDPFAGFGTTLFVAERMSRRPLGLEILPDRVQLVRDQLRDPSAILQGDTRALDAVELPMIDFSISSPPYMTRTDHDEDPLSGYQDGGGDYQRYLAELQTIYTAVAKRCAPGARIVVNVANLRINATNLAWDVGTALSQVLTFDHEVVIDWDHPPAWLTQDYCLVFVNEP